MPRILLNRTGHDSRAKLEAAAILRFREARKLQARGERLGALYLYGYSIEMRLKTTYYRLAEIGAHDDILQGPAPGAPSPRRVAETQIRAFLGLANGTQVGHNLEGWMRLLIDTRANHVVLGPFDPDFQTQLTDHIQAAAQQWIEYLRYRSNRP